jgi:hypothetical protein
MVFTSSYGASAFRAPWVSTVIWCGAVRRLTTPKRESMSSIVATSLRSGTFVKWYSPGARRVAARTGSVAFFEPPTATEP